MNSITSQPESSRNRSLAITLNKAAYVFSRRWFIGMVFLTGLWVGLPWLAPIFMRFGWTKSAEVIYFLYSFQCHQLPQRSFFLYGQNLMYPLDQIQAVWQDTFNPVVLRQFIGNPIMGYKVAWSDRMVSAYTSIPLAALLWWPVRKRVRPLTVLGFVLLSLPMAIDGGTHVISDLAGIGQGFRYTNEWLALLTKNSLPSTFYLGEALGSFNSLMRLITGILFGIGIVWLSFPHLHAGFEESTRAIEEKFARAGREL